MGLLYKLFGIKPTNYNEFYDALNKKNLREVTIKIGRESEAVFNAYTAGADILSVPYLEFKAGKLNFKDYALPPDGRISQTFSQEPLKKDLSLVLVMLELREKLKSEGIDCIIYKDDKLVDKRIERGIRKKTKKLGIN